MPRKRPSPAHDLGFEHFRRPHRRAADRHGQQYLQHSRVGPYWPLALIAAVAVDELGLADGLHLGRAVGAIHRAALDENRLSDVVAAVGVGQQLIEEKAVVRAIPQMVVRIDDLQFRLDDLLLAQRKPGGIGVMRVVWRSGCRTGGLQARRLGESEPDDSAAPPAARPSRSAKSGAIPMAVEPSFSSWPFLQRLYFRPLRLRRAMVRLRPSRGNRIQLQQGGLRDCRLLGMAAL